MGHFKLTQAVSSFALAFGVLAASTASWSAGNHYGWCRGVGNPHHSSDCGGTSSTGAGVSGAKPPLSTQLPGQQTPQPGVPSIVTTPSPVLVPPLTPNQVPQRVPIAVPPKVPQLQPPTAQPFPVPVLSPQLQPIPQAVPLAVPPLVPQRIPQPQQTPTARPFPVPVLSPQLQPTPQLIPIAVPPQVPQRSLQISPVQILTPSRQPTPRPQAIPIAIPGLVPQFLARPQPKPSATPNPRPIAIPGRVPQPLVNPAKNQPTSTKQTQPGPTQRITAIAPAGSITYAKTHVKSAQGPNYITDFPGRQPAHALPRHLDSTASEIWDCAVSGHGRRQPTNQRRGSQFSGALADINVVDAIAKDVPARHPQDPGCLVSIKRRYRN